MQSKTIQLYRNSFSGLSREVWLLTLVYFVNRVGSMVIPYLTIIMTASGHLTKVEAGYVLSSFGLGSLVGSYLGGWLTDRFGFYNVQFAGLFLSGVIYMLIPLVDTLEGYCLIFFLLSTVMDTYRPANNAAIAYYSKPENLTRSYGLIRMAANLGFGSGPLIGGFLIEWYGFDALFYADGLTCILASIILILMLSRPIQNGKTAPTNKNAEKANPLEGASPFRDKLFLVFVLTTIFYAFGFMLIFSMVPLYYKEVHLLSTSTIGIIMAINGLLIALTEMPLVYSLEKSFPPLRIMIWGGFLSGISLLSFLLPGIGILMAATFYTILITLGEMLFLPFSAGFVSSRASGGNIGRYNGLYSMAWSLTLIIGPYLWMLIAQNWGFNVLWTVCFLSLMLTVAGLYYLRGKNFLPEPPSS